ncbi:hypothetical protein Prudu_019087 [Prunus dulcis]|uniref:Non-ATPase subunit 9 n=1 Tax=Prunus dulcis TaxID=3755 RepID=A0A4Y1RS71_PRUDU|nr:hypothetical protein Prudu_019087 [Prunus dulcis]
MKFVSSAEIELGSTTTFSEEPKSSRGINTTPRVVKRKLQKIKPSYISVLARSKVPIVDKKWTEIPKDIKEQIWEAIDMAYVVGQGDWDAFVASRLSEQFESLHAKQAQRREKCEYNHRLSRKGYVGLEDDLEERMPGVEIDQSTLWKKAREDKYSNIPDPKVAEKAKLIDELQKQVSEGTLTVSGSNDVLTMALGPEHPGRVRGVGAGFPLGNTSIYLDNIG